MPTTLFATFDGEVLRPEKPIALEPGARVRLIVEAAEEEPPASFLQTARSLNLEGPPDWSARLEHYLYSDGPGSGEETPGHDQQPLP